MIQVRGLALLASFALVLVAFAAAAPAGGDGGRQIVLRDDCDPRDAAWDEIGGCALRQGDVDTEEFDEELYSPLSTAVIGHQAWRADPPYLEIKAGHSVRVVNKGGRPHTLTKVAQWGGGFIPQLSGGLTTAPECAKASVIPPGGAEMLSGLAAGNHRLICCLHPWMRALVKVHDRPGH